MGIKYSLVYEMKLSKNKYILSGIQIIILSQKSQFVHFLLKRKGGILYFDGHVTYDPNDPKNNIVSKMALWDLKPRA